MPEKKVPKSALRMVVGELQFKSNGDNAKTAPISMLARTGDPIPHWYWGNAVHDMSGMQLHKNRLPIDYAHNDSEIIGFLNHFDVSGGDLVASGALVPYGEQDRASEVIYKAREGVPYEASIDFSDEVQIEELGEGFVTQVNGREVAGPAVIFRKWSLRGVAVCAYGADKNTSSNLSSEAAEQILVQMISHESTKELQMSTEAPVVEAVDADTDTTDEVVDKNQDTEAQAVDVSNEEQPADVEAAADSTAEAPIADAVEAESEVEPAETLGQKFLRVFGDKGGVYFAKGMDFASALEAHVVSQAEQITQLQTQLAALKPERGLPSGVKFSPEPEKGEAKSLRDVIRVNKASAIRK